MTSPKPSRTYFRTKSTIADPDEISENLYEDPDAFQVSVADGGQSQEQGEVKAKPTPLPRIKSQLKPLYVNSDTADSSDTALNTFNCSQSKGKSLDSSRPHPVRPPPVPPGNRNNSTTAVGGHNHNTIPAHKSTAKPPALNPTNKPPPLPPHRPNLPPASPNYIDRPRSSINLLQEEVTELLRWLKRVSREPDVISSPVFGLSIEEEIRYFQHRATYVRTAQRLYNLLMTTRKDSLQKTIEEFFCISQTVDKVKKTNKSMGIAGGTTGAVGGVAAVVGIALAPMTMGASLIATAVGAGMVGAGGGFGACAAKSNKRIVNRTTVEKLVNDYMSEVVDMEQCLQFILTVMNELRRHNIDRLQRVGAHPDAVKMAKLSHAVFSNNLTIGRGMSLAQPGGVISGSLLKAFTSEMDFYFTKNNNQKLKKSNKSRFSGRVCTLAKNLQEELDYLTEMWEMLS